MVSIGSRGLGAGDGGHAGLSADDGDGGRAGSGAQNDGASGSRASGGASVQRPQVTLQKLTRYTKQFHDRSDAMCAHRMSWAPDGMFHVAVNGMTSSNRERFPATIMMRRPCSTHQTGNIASQLIVKSAPSDVAAFHPCLFRSHKPRGRAASGGDVELTKEHVAYCAVGVQGDGSAPLAIFKMSSNEPLYLGEGVFNSVTDVCWGEWNRPSATAGVRTVQKFGTKVTKASLSSTVDKVGDGVGPVYGTGNLSALSSGLGSYLFAIGDGKLVVFHFVMLGSPLAVSEMNEHLALVHKDVAGKADTVSQIAAQKQVQHGVDLVKSVARTNVRKRKEGIDVVADAPTTTSSTVPADGTGDSRPSEEATGPSRKRVVLSRVVEPGTSARAKTSRAASSAVGVGKTTGEGLNVGNGMTIVANVPKQVTQHVTMAHMPAVPVLRAVDVPRSGWLFTDYGVFCGSREAFDVVTSERRGGHRGGDRDGVGKDKDGADSAGHDDPRLGRALGWNRPFLLIHVGLQVKPSPSSVVRVSCCGSATGEGPDAVPDLIGDGACIGIAERVCTVAVTGPLRLISSVARVLAVGCEDGAVGVYLLASGMHDATCLAGLSAAVIMPPTILGPGIAQLTVQPLVDGSGAGQGSFVSAVAVAAIGGDGRLRVLRVRLAGENHCYLSTNSTWKLLYDVPVSHLLPLLNLSIDAMHGEPVLVTAYGRVLFYSRFTNAFAVVGDPFSFLAAELSTSVGDGRVGRADAWASGAKGRMGIDEVTKAIFAHPRVARLVQRTIGVAQRLHGVGEADASASGNAGGDALVEVALSFYDIGSVSVLDVIDTIVRVCSPRSAYRARQRAAAKAMPTMRRQDTEAEIMRRVGVAHIFGLGTKEWKRHVPRLAQLIVERLDEHASEKTRRSGVSMRIHDGGASGKARTGADHRDGMMVADGADAGGKPIDVVAHDHFPSRGAVLVERAHGLLCALYKETSGGNKPLRGGYGNTKETEALTDKTLSSAQQAARDLLEEGLPVTDAPSSAHGLQNGNGTAGPPPISRMETLLAAIQDPDDRQLFCATVAIFRTCHSLQKMLDLTLL